MAEKKPKEQSTKQRAWPLFDAIVKGAPFRHLNPWEGADVFRPDYETLTRLLGVPLLLDADTTSGVPALAFDVWVAYELRRAGLDPDAVWPREDAPRIIARDIIDFTNAQLSMTKSEIWERVRGGGSFNGTVGASANLLGKNYVKQVDVIMSHWSTGPEIMISTKRMDSSFGKNAANRVEESYGDAKNLRLRYPQAACGFVYGLRSTCWDESPDKAAWLVDLLTKLGREDDAYHAVALVVPQYGGELPGSDSGDDAPVGEPVVGEAEPQASLPISEVEVQLRELPRVLLRHDLVTPELDPARFFRVVLDRVLDNTPVDFHVRAREMRSSSG
ncbi:MAG: hypothetical protein ACSLEW_07025 [Nocardioides sp.]